MDGFRCFDMPLTVLENGLKKYGGMISEIAILEGDAIKKLYGDHRFHMALGYSQEQERRDMLAVAAYEGGEIVGVAGASNDTD